MKLSQKGFSTVVALLVVVVIAAIGIGGWYVWQRNHKKDTVTPSGSTSQNGENDKKLDEQKPVDETEGGKHLLIKDWGVKIPLSNDIAEAYYKIKSEMLADYVALYDASFDRLKNTDGVSCGGNNAYQFYSISRVKPKNAATLKEEDGSNYQEFPFTKEYLFSGVGAHQAPPPCSSLNPDPRGELQYDENIINIATEREQSFDNAFKQLRQ